MPRSGKQTWSMLVARLDGTPFAAVAERFGLAESTARDRVHRLLDHIADVTGRERASVGDRIRMPDAECRITLADKRELPQVVAPGNRESAEQVVHQFGVRPGTLILTRDDAALWGFDHYPAATDVLREREEAA